MKKTFSYYLKNKKNLYYVLPVLIVLILIFIFSRNSGSSIETAYSEIGNIKESITVTGTVKAFKQAELGFEKGGVVQKINFNVGDRVKAGDTIISLDSSDSNALLQGAVANLSAEQAKLAELEKGLRPEELSVETSKVKSAQTNYDDARIGIINALHDSYVKAESSVFNYADTFFVNPQSPAPRISVRTENYDQSNAVNEARLKTGEQFRLWKASLDSLTVSSDPKAYLDKVHSYLITAKGFMSFLSTIVSNLTPGNSGLSQTQIDSYNSIMNTGLSTFNNAVGSITSAEATYKSALSELTLANNQYDLKKAGSSSEELQAQSAKVDQAAANVSNYRAEVLKKRIVSPIDGIVSKIVPEQGEFVSAGQIVTVVISDLFKIEVNVPESDIAKVAVSNPATITLDAYDNSVVFKAHVISIDPAETIVEGIPTYKVTLQFDDKDSRIRSGMTANIDIVTSNKENVITVPFRAVLEKDNKKYVRVIKGMSNSNYDEVYVKTGVRGDDGKIEILEGLESGEKIVTFIK